MVVLSVMYPAKEGSRFDLQYYLASHMPMVQNRWGQYGMQGYQVLRGTGMPGGGAPLNQIVANLTFDGPDAIDKALGDADEILADIPRFTDVRPLMQISEVAG